MSTLFIADLHLSNARPEKLALFFQLLERTHQADALYILGDLFDAWLGDDDDNPPHPQILAALKEFSQRCAVYVTRGNHDFMLGADFERQSGARLLDDHTRLELYGEATLIMHGDTLCTLDVDYQNFRQMVFNPDWQAGVMKKSLAERAALSQQFKAGSAQAVQGKSMEIMDVDEETVVSVMREAGVYHLIHGHTHRPAMHEFEIDGEFASRTVLSDWYESDSVLECSEDGQCLMTVDEYISGLESA